MVETPNTSPDRNAVDPGRREPNEQFDRSSGFFGQDYSRDREKADGADHPSGHPLTGDPTTEAPAESGGRDIPRENGRRASFDRVTGEVHGSGSGAGEDFDAGTSGGAAEATAPDPSTRND